MIKIILFVLSISILSGSVSVKKCLSCHGNKFQNKAMGKSKIVKNMTNVQIYNALVGYKNRHYGGSLSLVMYPLVARYSDQELYDISNKIKNIPTSKLKSKKTYKKPSSTNKSNTTKKTANKVETQVSNKSNLPSLTLPSTHSLIMHKRKPKLMLVNIPGHNKSMAAQAQQEQLNKIRTQYYERSTKCFDKYKKTLKKNTLESFDNFVKECPRTSQTGEAINHIYVGVKKKGTISSYEWFADRYSSFPLGREAKGQIQKIKEKEKRAKQKAKQKRIAKQKKLNKKRNLEKKVARVWNEYKTLERLNSLDKYQDFINKYRSDTDLTKHVKKAKENYKILILEDL